MYRLITKTNNKPVVLMLYGPSGVGKTERAKSISKTMGGELLRIQFSMMQTTEAYNYVFGAEPVSYTHLVQQLVETVSSSWSKASSTRIGSTAVTC